MMEQGNAAAVAGHGVSIGDLALCAGAIEQGQLVLPFDTAVASGDAYYLVWPDDGNKASQRQTLLAFLRGRLPHFAGPSIRFAKLH